MVNFLASESTVPLATAIRAHDGHQRQMTVPRMEIGSTYSGLIDEFLHVYQGESPSGAGKQLTNSISHARSRRSRGSIPLLYIM